VSLDHYVSQAHLKNFYSSDLKELMYAIRKNDQKMFTPNSDSVCRIEENSTNSYLREDRIIEEFLKGVEPKYNSVVSKLSKEQIDQEIIYVIAGFVSYVLTCSPAGMRINSELFRGSVEEAARIMDKHKRLPPPPKELGGESLTEMLENGNVRIEIDKKYPQAMGITSVLSYVSIFGNALWEILINPFVDNPFFTSDFPVAIEKTKDPRVLNRIIPLAPNIAVRIMPDISLDRNNNDFTFQNFRYKYKKLCRKDIVRINRLLVQCAETTVFFNRNYDWVPKFVCNNSGFRIEPQTNRIPQGNGTILLFTQAVCEINTPNESLENRRA
jgi:hypothetical protein